MSELGRILRLRGLGPMPLENYTTDALANAIGHDDRPMKRALRAGDRSYHDPDWRLAFAKLYVAVTDAATITAKTQVPLLAANGVKLGYLDLVLLVHDARTETEIWIEVKVDAWEGVDQLSNYRKHAARRSPSPLVITLGKRRVNPSVPALRWSDIVDAIGSVPAPHEAWLQLREFLLDENIVRSPVPLGPINAGACIDVIVKVNRWIRDEVWRVMGIAWAEDRALRKMLVKSFTDSHELVCGAGPLRYGVMRADKGWEWGILVNTKNSQNVSLNAGDMLKDAETRRLSKDWYRYADRPEVLARRVGLETLESDQEAVSWFIAGLQQLHAAKIVEPFFVSLATKRDTGKRVKPAEATMTPDAHDPDGPDDVLPEPA